MHPNEKLILDFYEAFNQKNHELMAKSYHNQVHFKDEVFDLQGIEVSAMWWMLCEAASSDFRIECKYVQANESKGVAKWEAFYTFSRTKRKVHNKINAEFEFQDGKIIKHRDRFNFWSWSQMALGNVGLLLGWTGFLKNKIRKTAKDNLEKFMVKNQLK